MPEMVHITPDPSHPIDYYRDFWAMPQWTVQSGDSRDTVRAKLQTEMAYLRECLEVINHPAFRKLASLLVENIRRADREIYEKIVRGEQIAIVKTTIEHEGAVAILRQLNSARMRVATIEEQLKEIADGDDPRHNIEEALDA